MNFLAQMQWWPHLALAWLLILICGLLMLVILVQKGRGGGLSGAFGGGGGSSSAFGAKTGDVFTWITVALAAVFVLVAVAANFAFEITPPVAATPATEQGIASTTDTDSQPVSGEQTGSQAATEQANLPTGAQPATGEPAAGDAPSEAGETPPTDGVVTDEQPGAAKTEPDVPAGTSKPANTGD